VDWETFDSQIKGMGVPEINAVEFAQAPSEVRAFCHRLNAEAARDAFFVHLIRVDPRQTSKDSVAVLARFVSSGCESGAPWGSEKFAQEIHREYCDSIDWDTPSSQEAPPF
jgi:hypothetical protein